MIKLQLTILSVLLSLNIFGQVDKYKFAITEGNLTLNMPNEKWQLSDSLKGNLVQYIFKRDEIIDCDGQEIVPAIMIYIDDASAYKKDIVSFALNKQQPIMQNNVKIDSIQIKDENAAYPLSMNNSIFYKCHYTSSSITHILYMIFIINKKDIGIQIYMDMTKSIADEYEKEFISVIRSIIEQK